MFRCCAAWGKLPGPDFWLLKLVVSLYNTHTNSSRHEIFLVQQNRRKHLTLDVIYSRQQVIGFAWCEARLAHHSFCLPEWDVCADLHHCLC